MSMFGWRDDGSDTFLVDSKGHPFGIAGPGESGIVAIQFEAGLPSSGPHLNKRDALVWLRNQFLTAHPDHECAPVP